MSAGLAIKQTPKAEKNARSKSFGDILKIAIDTKKEFENFQKAYKAIQLTKHLKNEAERARLLAKSSKENDRKIFFN